MHKITAHKQTDVHIVQPDTLTNTQTHIQTSTYLNIPTQIHKYTYTQVHLHT